MNIKDIKEQFSKALANKDLSFVIKGSAFTAISMILIMGLRMCGGVLIGRFYGAEIFGELRLLTAMIGVVIIFANFGLKDAMLRLIPEYREKDNLRTSWDIYWKGLQFLFLFSLAGSIFLFFFVPWFVKFYKLEAIGHILKLSMFFIFPILLNGYNVFALRALFKVRDANVVSIIVVALRLIAIIICISFFFSIKRAPLYIYLFVICGTSAILSTYLIYKYFYLPSRAFKAKLSINNNQLLQLSFPMLLTYASFIINEKADTFMLMHFTNDTALVGIYGACLNLANLGRMGMQAMNVTIQPKLSQMYHGNRLNEIENVTRKTSKTFALLNIPITIALVFGAAILLSIYGVEFKIGAPALAVLAIGQMINTFAGPTAQLLNISGYHKHFMFMAFFGAVVNIIINLILIPIYGILGAAVAYAISMAAWNIIATIFIHQKFGFFIGYVPFLSEFLNKKKK